MNDRRRQTFFWMGVFVLPVFWAWWTLGKSHTLRERWLAFSWMTVFLALVIAQRQPLTEHWAFLKLGYPIVSLCLSVSLLVWLFFRLTGVSFPGTFIEWFVLIDIVPIMASLVPGTITSIVGKPFSAQWIIIPLSLSILHLLVVPFTLWRQGIVRDNSLE
jgi:hypothetical protein